MNVEKGVCLSGPMDRADACGEEVPLQREVFRIVPGLRTGSGKSRAIFIDRYTISVIETCERYEAK